MFLVLKFPQKVSDADTNYWQQNAIYKKATKCIKEFVFVL